MNIPNPKNNSKFAFSGLKLLNEKLKNYDVFFTCQKEEDGSVFGAYKGVRKMNRSTKKITNQDIMNLLTKKFEDIDKRFEDMDKRFEDIDKRFDGIEKDIVDMKKYMNKRFDKIDAKIDLMIQAPTMNKEIDHDALAKIDAR